MTWKSTPRFDKKLYIEYILYGTFYESMLMDFQLSYLLYIYQQLLMRDFCKDFVLSLHCNAIAHINL